MLKDLARANRSYRGFDEGYSISPEVLKDLVDCARLAPSSVNAQPFKYALIHEKSAVAKVQDCTKWARALPEMTLPHPNMCPTAFIVICQDLTIGDSIPRYQKDVGIVAQTILLAAVEQGLGGCMINNYSAIGVREALMLPDHMQPVLIVALGKPAETIVLTAVGDDGNTTYYRDENDVHYVPKRALDDIIL